MREERAAFLLLTIMYSISSIKPTSGTGALEAKWLDQQFS